MALAFALYCGGYALAREGRWLIHRVSFETDCDGRKSYSHWVDRGDFGPGIIFHRAIERQIYFNAQDSMYWAFTPLRWTEGLGWHIIPRDYGI